jgi:hypothetical protein
MSTKVTELSAIRTIVKAIDSEARVSKFADWEGEFVVSVRHEVTKIEKALWAAGYAESAPRDIKGGQWNWWTILTIKKADT